MEFLLMESIERAIKIFCELLLVINKKGCGKS